MNALQPVLLSFGIRKKLVQEPLFLDPPDPPKLIQLVLCPKRVCPNQQQVDKRSELLESYLKRLTPDCKFERVSCDHRTIPGFVIKFMVSDEDLQKIDRYAKENNLHCRKIVHLTEQSLIDSYAKKDELIRLQIKPKAPRIAWASNQEVEMFHRLLRQIKLPPEKFFMCRKFEEKTSFICIVIPKNYENDIRGLIHTNFMGRYHLEAQVVRCGLVELPPPVPDNEQTPF